MSANNLTHDYFKSPSNSPYFAQQSNMFTSNIVSSSNIDLLREGKPTFDSAI
jgi:hypothetical protein